MLQKSLSINAKSIYSSKYDGVLGPLQIEKKEYISANFPRTKEGHFWTPKIEKLLEKNQKLKKKILV